MFFTQVTQVFNNQRQDCTFCKLYHVQFDRLLYHFTKKHLNIRGYPYQSMSPEQDPKTAFVCQLDSYRQMIANTTVGLGHTNCVREACGTCRFLFSASAPMLTAQSNHTAYLSHVLQQHIIQLYVIAKLTNYSSMR